MLKSRWSCLPLTRTGWGQGSKTEMSPVSRPHPSNFAACLGVGRRDGWQCRLGGVIALPNPGNRHPLRKKVIQRWWRFLSKIVCRGITEDLKAVLMLLFCRLKVFMQIRRSPEQRNIFWSGLGKQLKKLRGKILWLQNSSTPLLVSYLIYWIYAFIVWREFSWRKMKKHRLMLMINLC